VAASDRSVTGTAAAAAKGMRWQQKLFYSVGHVHNDLCASMWFTLFIVFLQYIIHFQDALAGYLLLLGQLVDAAWTPVVGYLCDLTSGFCRLGRRKSWHLVGSFYRLFTRDAYQVHMHSAH